MLFQKQFIPLCDVKLTKEWVFGLFSFVTMHFSIGIVVYELLRTASSRVTLAHAYNFYDINYNSL